MQKAQSKFSLSVKLRPPPALRAFHDVQHALARLERPLDQPLAGAEVVAREHAPVPLQHLHAWLAGVFLRASTIATAMARGIPDSSKLTSRTKSSLSLVAPEMISGRRLSTSMR